MIRQAYILPQCRTAVFMTAAISALLASACVSGTKITAQEQELLDTMSPGQYFSRTQEEREAIQTQPLFAQTAFWSKEYDLNPADLEAAINLSSSLRKLGNPTQALEISQSARSIYPRDLGLVAEFAASLIALEQGKSAIAPLSAAVRQDTNNPRLWSLLGAAHDQIAQYLQAREFYNRALALTPTDPNILANVGLSYALEGDARTAEVWLRRAAADRNASANVRQNLAIVLGLQGKYDEAEQLARQDLAPDGAENNLAYLRSMKSSSRSYDAISDAPAPTAAQPAQSWQSPARSSGASAPTKPSYSSAYSPAPSAPAASPLTPRVYGGAAAQTASPQRQAQPAAPTYSQAQPQMRHQQSYTQTSPYTQQASSQSPSVQAALDAAKQRTAQAPVNNYQPPSTARTQEQKDILAQISASLAGKAQPQSQMTYREMEAKSRQDAQLKAQQYAQAQQQAQQQGQVQYQQQMHASAQGYNAYNVQQNGQGVNVTAYPQNGYTQQAYAAQAQQQATGQSQAPQRRAPLRTRY